MNGVAPGYRRDEGTSRFRRRALSPMPLACCCGTAGRGHESELPSLRHRPHQIVRRGCPSHVAVTTWPWHPRRIPGAGPRGGPGSPVTGIPGNALRTEINLSEAALALSPSMTPPIPQRACPRSASSQMVPEEAHQHKGTQYPPAVVQQAQHPSPGSACHAAASPLPQEHARCTSLDEDAMPGPYRVK